jgi:YfiH family protein
MTAYINTDIPKLIFEYSSLLSREKSLTHFFTTRAGGNGQGTYATLNLGMFCNDDPETVIDNRKILCHTIGINEEKLIVPEEVHSADVKEITESFFYLSPNEKGIYLSACDGLLTNLSGCCLAVTTADCVPVLLYDKKNGSIAAIHAGWKGIVKKIIPAAIEKMSVLYGTKPHDIIAATGPCISAQMYEVSEEMIGNFESVFSPEIVSQLTESRDGKFYIDLRKAVFVQCLACQIPESHIGIHPHCTYQMPELYFSARRDSFNSGRMLSGIMLI